MRTMWTRFSLAAVVALPCAMGVLATPSYATSRGGMVCSGNSGSITLSPGLEEETTHVQNIIIQGVLSGCTGSTVTEATYLAHLKTKNPVSCGALANGETASGKVVIQWTPTDQGNSHGRFTMTLTGSPNTITGKVKGGPVAKLGLWGPITPSYGECGGSTKLLKEGTFTGSEFRVTGPPKAKIESPKNHGVYALDAEVPTSFSCTEDVFGPGLESCVDSNGATEGSGMLDTATAGSHTYSVVARSIDGQKGVAKIHYKVQ
jgi:hypothetical protein